MNEHRRLRLRSLSPKEAIMARLLCAVAAVLLLAGNARAQCADTCNDKCAGKPTGRASDKCYANCLERCEAAAKKKAETPVPVPDADKKPVQEKLEQPR